MEDFVAKDLLENRAGFRVVADDLAVDREASGGGFLGDVQEREQPVIGLAFDPEVVEAVAARQRVAVEA